MYCTVVCVTHREDAITSMKEPDRKTSTDLPFVDAIRAWKDSKGTQ